MDGLRPLSRRAWLAGVGAVVGAGASVASAGSSANALTYTDTTPRAHGSLALVSDSQFAGLTYDLRRRLRDGAIGPLHLSIRGLRTIARPRHTDSGLRALARMRRAGFAPSVLLVSLGGNDFVRLPRQRDRIAADVETFLDAAGPDVVVGWFTVWHRFSPTLSDDFAALLRAAADARPNVVVVDWATVARAHPEWTRGHRVHLNRLGALAHNAYAVEVAQELLASRP